MNFIQRKIPNDLKLHFFVCFYIFIYLSLIVCKTIFNLKKISKK